MHQAFNARAIYGLERELFRVMRHSMHQAYYTRAIYELKRKLISHAAQHACRRSTLRLSQVYDSTWSPQGLGCNFFWSSNLIHKSCGIFVASWGFANCIGTRLVFHNFFYLNVRRTNGAMQKTHKVLKMRLLIFTLAAFIGGSLEPQRLLIQIWRSSVTDACKQSEKSWFICFL